MESSVPATRTIEVSDEAYDILARTAATRGTDIDGALRYLLEVPAVLAAPSQDDDEE
ncbi:hypothetical protein ACNTMW_12870 [Planosporangium sp. 12N6]|uniref:hypothetical protein n=1 Tax=Planosporangium spinosum TaxID=3402278 RepID=UPI003CEDD186